MRILTSCILSGVIAVGLLVGPLAHAGAHAEKSEPVVTTAELLQYTRIYTGDDGETHFDDVSVTFRYEDYGTNIPTVWLSEGGLMDVKGFHFVSMPAGWDGGKPHPAPARQFIMPLSGRMEFEVSDGEKRVFGPGDVLLVEDTTGKGHVSQMVSSGLGLFAVVPLPEE